MHGAFDAVLKQCISTFGVSVVYIRGPECVSVIGVFDKNYVSVDPETGVPVQSTDPILGVREQDLPGGEAKRGDTVTIDSVQYRVVDVQQDSEGGAKLILRRAGNVT